MNTPRMSIPVLCIVCILFGPAFTSAQDVAGAWNIVAEPGSINTCPEKAEAAAYQWLVSEKAGDVSVTVQGETAYPRLTGKVRGARLLLEGEGRGRVGATAYPNAVFVLDVKGRTMSGTRYVMHFKPARQGGMTTCLVTYTVSGTMM